MYTFIDVSIETSLEAYLSRDTIKADCFQIRLKNKKHIIFIMVTFSSANIFFVYQLFARH